MRSRLILAQPAIMNDVLALPKIITVNKIQTVSSYYVMLNVYHPWSEHEPNRSYACAFHLFLFFLSFFLSSSLPVFLSCFLSLLLSFCLSFFLAFFLSCFLSFLLSFCLSFFPSFFLSSGSGQGEQKAYWGVILFLCFFLQVRQYRCNVISSILIFLPDESNSEVSP